MRLKLNAGQTVPIMCQGTEEVPHDPSPLLAVSNVLVDLTPKDKRTVSLGCLFCFRGEPPVDKFAYRSYRYIALEVARSLGLEEPHDDYDVGPDAPAETLGGTGRPETADQSAAVSAPPATA